MPLFLKWAGAVLVGAWLFSGCSTTAPVVPPQGSSSAQKSSLEKPTVPLLSPAEENRRIEGHAYYADAVVHEYNEEWDQAKEDYLKAGQADPENESLILDCSQRLLLLKDPAKAMTLLTNACNSSKASPELLAQLGRIQFMLGKKDEAIQSNRAALRKSPRLLAAYRNLAQIYLQDRKYQEAIDLLDQAAKQPDVEPIYLIEVGQLYMAFLGSGPPNLAQQRALDTFKQAAEMKITNIFQIQTLADSLAILGETGKATELYERLLKYHPPIPGVREKLAGLYIRNKDLPNAEKQLRSLLNDHPLHPQANFLMGSVAFEEKKLPEAINYFNKTIQLNPEFEPVYYDLAAAQLSNKEARKALETLGKARDKFKQNYVCEYYTALAYSQLKEYTNVIQHLTTAEVIARGNDETNRLNHIYYFQLGAAYERSQKFAEAEKYMTKCLELSPDFSEALNYLGYMYAEKGTNLVKAREMIEKALKEEPKNGAFLDSLAWVFFKMGKPQEAFKYMQAALENTKEPDPTLYDHLGDVYQALSKPDQAREAWKKSISLEPNPDIQKKLDSAVPRGGSK